MKSTSVAHLQDFLRRLYDILAGSPDQFKVKPLLNEAINDESGEINPLIVTILNANTGIKLSPAEILLHMSKKEYQAIIQAAERAFAVEKLVAEWNNF